MKNIIIICDFNKNSGFGHLSRMKSLARAFNKKKFSVKFIFENKYKDYNKDFLKGYNCDFLNFSLKKNSKKIIEYLQKNFAKIIILDSYYIDLSLEKKLYQKFFIVCFDDKLKKHKSHLVINSREDINSRELSSRNQYWKTGKNFLLIGKTKKRNKSNSKIKKVLIHGGGSSAYNYFQTFLYESIRFLNSKKTKLQILCKNPETEDKIKKKLKKQKLLKKNVYFTSYNENLSQNLKNYDVVVGPSGITTFETIASNVLPVSFPIIEDGRDSTLNWNLNGNVLHLNKEEIKSIKMIKQIWVFIFKNYQILSLNIKNKSRQIKDNSKEISQMIINYSSEKKDYSFTKKQDTKLKILEANFDYLRSFLQSRNNLPVRKVSSNPRHIITFSEHLNWWINDKIKKFVLVKDKNEPVAYHWVKLMKIFNGEKTIISGWFPEKKGDISLNSLKIILEHQKMYIKRNYKNAKWIININKNNSFSKRLNKSMGFKYASEKSQKIGKNIFNISLDKFDIFEMKI
tara:strand:- start:12326 stop:13867 length:1542 start_codon:yes stop_codon:yes gene_type:complete